MSDPVRLLVVDNDQPNRQYIDGLLKERGFSVESSGDGIAALKLIGETDFDILITDLEMPRLGGLGLLSELKEKAPSCVTIVMSGKGTIETAVQAMKLGAYDYIEKPVQPETLLKLIENIIDNRQLWERSIKYENNQRKNLRFENIIGYTPQMHKIFEEIRDVGDSDASLLIIGENGTGKELVADAIHFKRLKGKPYIKINCGALPESIVESELFGHERGAFTGASSRKKGRIEMANEGTLFLDEFGELTPSTQVKLLRVLETGEFQRVGGTKTLHSSFRLICATNKDLMMAVMRKEFREDLFYRINTVTIRLPPLRERKADIPILVQYFLDQTSKKAKKNVLSVSKEVMSIFMNHDWPGNVRELAHIIERALIYCKGSQIVPENLPATLTCSDKQSACIIQSPSKALSDVESSHICNILEESNWNLRLAAKTLQIARGTLYSKMEKYGIRKPQ